MYGYTGDSIWPAGLVDQRIDAGAVPAGTAAVPIALLDIRRHQAWRAVAKRPIVDASYRNDAAGCGGEECFVRFGSTPAAEICGLRIDAHFLGEIKNRAPR